MTTKAETPRLPDEIWVQVLEYLDPPDLFHVQRTSSQLLKIARDTSLWRAKCFEKAPSAAHAFSSTSDSLTDLLNGLSLAKPSSESLSQQEDRRSRAIVIWDCTDRSEKIDWSSEYTARHAPLSTEWLHHLDSNEVRSMALFDKDKKVLGAMEDGSLRIWDVKKVHSGRRSLRVAARSKADLLFSNLSATSGPSASMKQRNVGTAIDSTVVDRSGTKAYIAVEDTLNEVDLSTMSLISQQKYAWNITAISQQADEDVPLMIGTSFSLHMHDPRIHLRHQIDRTNDLVDVVTDEHNTVFLPNYAKGVSWNIRRKGPSQPSIQGGSPGMRTFRSLYSQATRPRADPEAWAPVEPGPQTILHRGKDEIIVAGRMPSILFYDKRVFPQLHYVIHSGARLSSLATIPYAPHSQSPTTAAEATLIAAGEYHGRGSLELYELPHNRPTDCAASYDYPPPEEDSPTNGSSTPKHPTQEEPDDIEPASSSLDATQDPNTPYSYRNRQSSSSAKLLSVASQGARIVYSDSEGSLKWVERDGRGLARKWNINSYQYSHSGGQIVGESAVRKILTFDSDTTSSEGMTRGDGDLLIWTGSDLGIVTTKVKWTGHDELVAAFEEKLNLDDSQEGAEKRTESDVRRQEEEYGRIMRRALERQADERRFLARFGRFGGGW